MDENDLANPAQPITVVRSYMTLYGQLAFGVVTLFVIFLGICKPMMDANAIDWERNQKLTEAFRDISFELKTITNEMRQVANDLRMTLERNRSSP